MLLVGCSSPAPPPGSAGALAAGSAGAARELRLGFVPGVTDASALVGMQMGFFGEHLGRVTLEPVPLSSAADEVTALEHGQLDAAYLDPVAAVMAWQSSARGLVRIVAGAASGGAELVVAKGITRAGELAHRPLAAPEGSAQEAAFSYWLRQHSLPGLTAGAASGMTGTEVVQAFRSGHIAGGWEPAPVDAEMAAAGGRVLVNEASLWPGGRFSTVVLVVTQRFASADPAAVSGLLRGQVQSDDFIATDRTSAEAALGQKLTAVTGSGVAPSVLASSFAQVTLTDDPLAGSVLTEARHAAAVGMLKPVKSLGSIYDLAPLNAVLRAAGQRPVSS